VHARLRDQELVACVPGVILHRSQWSTRMPANIDQTTGTAAVMTVGPAWHRLGKELNAPATAAEAIKYACLDWRVSKMPR